MSSTERSNQNPVAAFIGIDWADQKHAIVLRAAASTASLEHRSIGAEPDALAEWVLEVRERFAGEGRILVCLEQSRGALIHFLMGYECFELYPINPKELASYREAFRPSGAKDDPSDAELLWQFVSLHHGQLRPWRDGSLLEKRDPPLRSGLLSNVPSSFAVARPWYCGRAVAQRAKGGLRATADTPGRALLRMPLTLVLTRMGSRRAATNHQSPLI